MMKKLLIGLLTVILILTPCSALNLPQGFNYTLEPGESRIETITISNELFNEVNVSVIKEGNGSSWIFLGEDEFSIPTFSSYQFTFYISIPSSASEGVYTSNLTFIDVFNGTPPSYNTRALTLNIEYKKYLIIDEVWINLGQAFSLGDYEVFPTDVSIHDSCFTKVTKNGVEVFEGPINSEPVDINGLRVSVAESYASASIMTCRYNVLADESLSYEVIDSEEAPEVSDDEVAASINLYGSLKPGLPVVFELVNDKGKLLPGRLIITGPKSGTDTVQGDGLFNYIIQKDETGPITVMAYHNNMSVSHAVFTIAGGGSFVNDTSQDDGILSGELVIRFDKDIISPYENIVVRLVDDYSGDPVLSADVFVNNPCGPDVAGYTNEAGAIAFTPTLEGWCEGVYTVEVRRAGYTPSPKTKSLTVELLREDTEILFYYKNKTVDDLMVLRPVKVKIVDSVSEEAIDFNGYGMMEYPDGNESSIKFIDGESSFTPLLIGPYEIEVTDLSIGAEELPYYGSDGEIDIKEEYIPIPPGPKFWDYIPLIGFVLFIVLIVWAIYKLARMGRKKSKGARMGFARKENVPSTGKIIQEATGEV